MRGIVWLASYPKSGNTWFRTFLENLLTNADEPVSINALGGLIASGRIAFDEAVGYDSGELTPEEVDQLRPEVYLEWARTAKKTLYCKVHDAYTFLPDGRPLIPPEATACALYFVRNPLDVAVSLAHHSGHDGFDRVIGHMADVGYAFSESTVTEPNQLRQRLLSWSAHVTSWADATGIRVQTVRYEDMSRHPEETFGAAARFAQLPADAARLAKAIAFSRFTELRRQEEVMGFRERAPQARSFFREGEVGTWRNVLLRTQVEQIIADHGAVMRRFGYLDEAGYPVC